MDAVIEACNLCKSFPGGTMGVSGLDLSVRRGVVYGLIGRNGSGKTTTLRLLMGLLKPDKGRALILGADLWTAPRDLRQKVAYISQLHQVPGWMTLDELSRYVAHFYTNWDRALARSLAQRWELPWHRAISVLSAGEQRQAAILLALSAHPEVLLLDEPAVGLDPIARRCLLDSLIEAMTSGDGCAVLFSTHLISDLERVAEYIGIMDRGRITTSMKLEDLIEGTKRVQVVFDRDEPPDGFTIPGAIRSVTRGPVVTAIVRFTCESQLDPVRRLPGARVDVFPMGLEEVFVELLGKRDGGETHGGARQGELAVLDFGAIGSG